MDFAVGLVNSILNLNSNYRRLVINTANQKAIGLFEMTCGLVHASYSLPKWQTVKLTFFAPWLYCLAFSLFDQRKVDIKMWGTCRPYSSGLSESFEVDG